MTEIRTACQDCQGEGKCRKASFPRAQQKAASTF